MQLMASAKRSYGGETAEERRTRRRAALIEAALDLFAESGANGVTKRSVCQRARLNDRYFYEHFSNADDLLRAVANELTAQGLQVVVAATLDAPTDMRAQVHAAAVAALDFMTADPRRGQLLLGAQTTEVLQRARLDSIRAIAKAMAAMTRELLGDSAPTHLVSDLTSFTLVSGTWELVAAWLRGDYAIDQEHLVDIVAAMLHTTVDISAALPNRAE